MSKPCVFKSGCNHTVVVSGAFKHLVRHSLVLLVLLSFQSTVSAQDTLEIVREQSAIPLTAGSKYNKKSSDLFQQTLSAIKKGHKTNSKRGLAKLKDYPLYPYLVKEDLIKRFRNLPFKEVDHFLAQNKDTVAGKQLHQKWLFELAKRKRWEDFNRYYVADVSGSELNCLRVEALHQTGFTQIALDKTAAYWLSKKSMPDSCDSIFKRWEQVGMKTDALVWERIQLALNAKNSLLARYLSKKSSALLKPYARRIISVHRDPRRLKKLTDFSENSTYNRDIVSYGLKRLATRDQLSATRLWIHYRGFLRFSKQQNHEIRNKLARQVIASGSDEALNWLIVHDPNAEDTYLMEWRIRLALRQQKWSQSRLWISMLPAEKRESPRWRYWLAKTYLQQNPYSKPGTTLLYQLANERHYYGFLAADLVGFKYGFNHKKEIATNNQVRIDQNKAIQRSYEFLQQHDLVSARREWNSAVKHLDQPELIAATELAHRWQWHQQAILTTIKANKWNDLTIRFPLAFQSSMIDSASNATIRPEWLYAIARQESAFATDAYSSAGARGLLQLTAKTAQRVASKMGLTVTKHDLFKAEKNISLGSNYLKQLLNDFNGSHILATAAYNAGPHRVKKWLKRQPEALPHDIWIETLPYHETRDYIQNVLAFSVIYGYRLGSDTPLIGNQDTTIGISNGSTEKKGI